MSSAHKRLGSDKNAKELGERFQRDGVDVTAIQDQREIEQLERYHARKEASKATVILPALTPPTPTQPHPTPPNPTLDDEREHLVQSMLAKGRPPVGRLKGGMHAGVYYVGTNLYRGLKRYQAVVTSDGRIYVDWGKGEKNEIRDEFKLLYRYELESDVLDSQWSLPSIRHWLNGSAHIPTIGELYERMLAVNRRHMYYPDDRSHKVIALDILSTYWLPLYESKGRTFIEAEPGSGKTRQCTIYKLLACNSIMSADLSKASFSRLMESTCWTLIIDDFDSVNEEQKTDVLQHYKTGYKDTSKTVRTGEAQGAKRSIDAFRNYGHVVMNNTAGLDRISAERTIFLPLLKTDKEISKNDLNEQSPEWTRLRDDCYCAALTWWPQIRDAYAQVTSALRGRKFEISRPLLAIASLISQELKTELEAWLQDRFEEVSIVDLDSDWTYLAVSEFQGGADGDKMLVRDIAEHIGNKTLDPLSKDYRSRVHGISVYLGKMFRGLPGIFRVVTINSKPWVRLLSRAKLDDYARMKGWVWSGQVGLGGVGGHCASTLLPVLEDLNQSTPASIRNGVDLLAHLRASRAGASTEELLQATPEDLKGRERWLVATLKTLANRGEIFSDKPDHWRALE